MYVMDKTLQSFLLSNWPKIKGMTKITKNGFLVLVTFIIHGNMSKTILRCHNKSNAPYL